MVEFGEPVVEAELDKPGQFDIEGFGLVDVVVEAEQEKTFTGEKKPPLIPEPNIPDDEAEFAAAHPNTYAAGKTFWGILSSMRQAAAPTEEERAEQARAFTSLVPFAKYTLPEKRKEFWKLSQQEQVNALLWDTLETALLFPAGPTALGKGLGKVLAPLTKGIGKLRPKFKFKPVEDLVLRETKPFYREVEASNLLKKKGFARDEIEAILGDELLGFYRRKMHMGEPVSKALAREVRWEGGRFTTSPGLRKKLGENALRGRHFRREWRRIASQHIGQAPKAKGKRPTLGERKVQAKHRQLEKEVFDAQVRDTLGEEAIGKVTLKNANDYYMANMVKHLLKHPRVTKTIKEAGEFNKAFPDSISPTRIVFGQWEKAHGARSRIHLPLMKAKEASNEYTYEKTMTLMQMYKERGLGTWSRTAAGALRFDPAFGEGSAKRVYDAMVAIDGITRIELKNPHLIKQMQGRIKGIVDGLSPMERRLMQTHNDFFDHLYAEHVILKLPQLFEKAGLTSVGQRGIDGFVQEIGRELGKHFSKASAYKYKDKKAVLHDILSSSKNILTAGLRADGTHPWFKAEGKELAGVIQKLGKELQLGKEGGFTGYLENYTARVRKTGSKAAERWENDLVGKMKAFYTKERKSILGFDLVEDLGSMLGARIRAQANELFFYPEVDDVVRYAKGLPREIREYTDHYLARSLGRSSNMDEKMARLLERTVGKLGGKEYWTAEKIGNVARRLNDLAIVGGLGFKPFAVMRDMFQPLLTVPADLGGLKGFWHLLRGYHTAFTKPGVRKYVRDIGAITEFAPELYLKQRILPFEKGAKWDHLRDAGLYLYGFSDRANRYVTGAAAFEKWDTALARVGGIEKASTKAGMANFGKKVGLEGRYPWIRSEVEELLAVGRWEDAKKVFVKDVVEDCQFLYRTTEAPIISQKGGALGKTGFLFQSWWANYGNLLEKWLRTGDAGTKANRMFTWMLSSAMAAQLMEPLWGTGTALRTVGTGPFPLTMNKYMLPPAYAPIYEFANMVGYAIPQHLWKGEPEKLEQAAKDLFKSFTIFVPGGLQLAQIAKGVTEEGGVGLAKSIIRFNQAKDYKPLWGLGQEGDPWK